MRRQGYDVVVCGAGLAGASTAYHLQQTHPPVRVAMVDSRPPLSLTSSRSTECYRDYWPSECMVNLMDRSIAKIHAIHNQLMESEGREGCGLSLCQKGYSFFADTDEASSRLMGSVDHFHRMGRPVREVRADDAVGDDGLSGHGLDVYDGPESVRKHYPWAGEGMRGCLKAKRCGWLDAQRLGGFFLEEAKRRGLEVIRGEVVGVDISSSREGQVVTIRRDNTASPTQLSCPTLVLAGGPFLPSLLSLINAPPFPLPAAAAAALTLLPPRVFPFLVNEVHAKVILKDTLGLMPQDHPNAGMQLYSDSQVLDWPAVFREDPQGFLSLLRETEGGMPVEMELVDRLLGRLADGAHFRPYRPDRLLIIWDVMHDGLQVTHPPPPEPSLYTSLYPEVAVRGIQRLIPRLSAYLGQLKQLCSVDGGYYCKAPDNRPVIGPLPTQPSVIICGGLGGFGVMASPAAGELAALHVMKRVSGWTDDSGASFPSYTEAFLPSRFCSEVYLNEVCGPSNAGKRGQI
ncbi:unnamed protein product [Vitrella brassicaformis CCMP3155]|uniref:FAD-dependent oxidoreductase domain-containing protein 1 n=1 Tax=Vitrella brassicaformis (strain CCMP3155) TaxID=1169540 RepID=A0A0G4EI15_VITBC|nr:unnamed protein product [Vitrella brassicaformis CCMP3155]|eukprot:CEL96618.1 unnamed protein product [Vitrella brassicaformis CCMP3155]